MEKNRKITSFFASKSSKTTESGKKYLHDIVSFLAYIARTRTRF